MIKLRTEQEQEERRELLHEAKILFNMLARVLLDKMERAQ